MRTWNDADKHIGEICALKKQDLADYAQETLEKVYRYVLPIMRQRNYRVVKLVEFLPRNPNLLGLNVNRGQRISLRLRRSQGSPKEFLPFESVLGTMLHELCHNTFGPHDSNFFKLLDELTLQMETLIAKGFRGDPFVGTGVPLGGSVRSISASSSLNLTHRKPNNTRMIGKGRKLGASSAQRRANRTSLRELALEAAERRKQADSACKTSKNLIDLPEDEKGELIDLTIEDPPGHEKVSRESETINHSNQNKSEPVNPEVIYILD